MAVDKKTTSLVSGTIVFVLGLVLLLVLVITGTDKKAELQTKVVSSALLPFSKDDVNYPAAWSTNNRTADPKATGSPGTACFDFWHATNVADIHNTGAKAKFDLLGPFCSDSYYYNAPAVWTKDGELIEYASYVRYVYNDVKSCATCRETTMINIADLTTAFCFQGIQQEIVWMHDVPARHMSTHIISPALGNSVVEACQQWASGANKGWTLPYGGILTSWGTYTQLELAAPSNANMTYPTAMCLNLFGYLSTGAPDPVAAGAIYGGALGQRAFAYYQTTLYCGAAPAIRDPYLIQLRMVPNNTQAIQGFCTYLYKGQSIYLNAMRDLGNLYFPGGHIFARTFREVSNGKLGALGYLAGAPPSFSAFFPNGTEAALYSVQPTSSTAGVYQRSSVVETGKRDPGYSRSIISNGDTTENWFYGAAGAPVKVKIEGGSGTNGPAEAVLGTPLTSAKTDIEYMWWQGTFGYPWKTVNTGEAIDVHGLIGRGMEIDESVDIKVNLAQGREVDGIYTSYRRCFVANCVGYVRPGWTVKYSWIGFYGAPASVTENFENTAGQKKVIGGSKEDGLAATWFEPYSGLSIWVKQRYQACVGVNALGNGAPASPMAFPNMRAFSVYPLFYNDVNDKLTNEEAADFHRIFDEWALNNTLVYVGAIPGGLMMLAGLGLVVRGFILGRQEGKNAV